MLQLLLQGLHVLLRVFGEALDVALLAFDVRLQLGASRVAQDRPARVELLLSRLHLPVLVVELLDLLIVQGLDLVGGGLALGRLGGDALHEFGERPDSAMQISAYRYSPRGMTGVQTIAQTLPDYRADNWFGIGLPAGTPQPIADRLNAEVRKLVADKEFADRLVSMGYQPIGDSTADMKRAIQADRAKWKKVIEATGIRAE